MEEMRLLAASGRCKGCTSGASEKCKQERLVAGIPVQGSSKKLPGFGVQDVTTVMAFLAQNAYRSAQRLCHALAVFSSCCSLAYYQRSASASPL
jgi:hypothetical protein